MMAIFRKSFLRMGFTTENTVGGNCVRKQRRLGLRQPFHTGFISGIQSRRMLSQGEIGNCTNNPAVRKDGFGRIFAGECEEALLGERPTSALRSRASYPSWPHVSNVRPEIGNVHRPKIERLEQVAKIPQMAALDVDVRDQSAHLTTLSAFALPVRRAILQKTGNQRNWICRRRTFAPRSLHVAESIP